jgi:Domain of unknown function (DUF929)
LAGGIVTKTTLTRRRAEQARIARERAAAAARRRRIRLAASAVSGVLLILVALVVVKLVSPRNSATSAASVPSTVVDGLLHVSPGTLDSAGRGTVTTLPTRLTGRPALTDNAKPLVLYVGAEYCPFCAAQRWGLIVALSRFGAFTGLSAARSATDDVYPGTATMTFHGVTYASPYLAFQGIELATSERRGNSYAPLDTLTSAQQKVMAEYDAAPYVPAGSAGAVPFVDLGNRFMMTGATFSPQLLSGLTHEQIVTALGSPDGPVSAAVLGSANAFTAVLCGLTGGQPGTVCQSTAVTAYAELSRAS